MFSEIYSIVADATVYLIQSLLHNGIYLFLSITLAVAMTVYLDAEKVKKFFYRKPGLLIPGSVATGALTPLCACGTMAVLFALMGSALPWGPIMAFLVSSPLMSPDTFILLTGFIGVKFALLLMIASIILGLASGYLTWIIEKKSGYFDNQLKIMKQESKSDLDETLGQMRESNCNCQGVTIPVPVVLPKTPVCCSNYGRELTLHREHHAPVKKESAWSLFIFRLKPRDFIKQFYSLGIRKILPLFVLFIIIAYGIKTYIPTEWVVTMFNGENFYSVPLAAVIGLPLYISDATIVPLLQVLKNAGASDGALLAFMISGPGTSLGVTGGLMIILKKKAIGLYLAFIFFGAIILGYLTDLLL